MHPRGRRIHGAPGRVSLRFGARGRARSESAWWKGRQGQGQAERAAEARIGSDASRARDEKLTGEHSIYFM